MDMDGHYPSSYVLGELRELFPQVDLQVLKLIASEHGDDIAAATTAVIDDVEYYQLRDMFPMVDVNILKAFSSEYRNNLEAAITIILDEVMFSMPHSYDNHHQSLQPPDHDHDVALLMKTQLFKYRFEKMGDYNNYVFNQLSELFPQVNHRILKTVSFNHQYNLNAAIEVIMDNFVFEQLKDVFPLVDDEILKAIADEHSDNAEVAINEILHEVVPYMPSYIGGSDGADVLESAVQWEADEMKQVKQLVGSTPEEAKVGEDSTYFDDPSEHTLLADSSVSRSLGVNEEPMLEDYVSVSREMCEKLEEMAEDATKNKEEKPIVEFQKDEEQDGEEEGDIDSKAIVKQDISEELLNVSKVLQEEVQEHSKMIQDFLLKHSPMVVKEMESLAPEESDEKLDDKELLSQRPALSNKSRKLGSLSSLQDSTTSIKVPEEIETPSPICWSPIGGTKENVIDDDHQKLHEDDWEFIGHSDAE